MGERQYYYFYGSTSEGSNGGPQKGENESAPPRLAPSSPAVTESDSLIGEGLVSTDNEDDTPMNSDADFQQLLVSHGKGRLHPLDSLPERSRKQNCLSWWVSWYKRFRRSHSVSHMILIVAGVMLFLSLLALMFSPRSVSGIGDSSAVNPIAVSQERAKNFKIPWPEIDRSAYNDPVTNFMDPTLFHSSLLNNNSNGNGKSQFIFPFPTGAFWTNLVLPPTADRSLSYPIAVYPYAYKWSDCLLEASYPAQHRKEEPKAIHDYFFPDLTFGVSEEVASRKIVAFDPLSVTLRYYTDKRDVYWETYLVQGSPYITIKFSKMSPVITAFTTFTNVICPREDLTPLEDGTRRRRRKLKFGVCSSNNDTTEQKNNQVTTLHGVQFTIETQEGVRWIVFASELVILEMDMQTRTTISVSAENGQAFTGVLRFAIIPPVRDQQHGSDSITTQTSSALDQILQSTGMKRLIYHAGVYPVSGAVSWSFRSASMVEGTDSAINALHSLTGASESTSSLGSTDAPKGGRIGTIEFKFGTKSFTPTTTGPKSLLMLALPHHAQSLPSSSQLGRELFDFVFQCIKGPMRPILGSSWSYDVPLPSLGFDGDSGSNSEKLFMSPGVRSHILKSLTEDVKLALPTATENIYGFGKQAARLAQLAHIAHVIHSSDPTSADETDATASSVFQEAKELLQAALAGFLRSKVSDSLVYDANLGGMVTTDGLLNSNADFGNGRYNDHHFHYGYLLYACAVMGKLDPLFVKEFGDGIDSVYYDIAHGSNFESKGSIGPFFPGARHKIWFDGHSFASGMFPFGNGKSQESSSEAVNGYYGAYLWSVVRNGAAEDPASDESPQTDFARLLLAMEIRGARTYWHMLPSKSKNETDTISAYSPQFTENYMVGNLGMLDALCSTWFGNEELYVHMINFLPVTAATGDLFGSEFVSQEYVKILQPLREVEMAWLGYIVADRAIVDPNAAWLEAEKLFSPTLDSALSKSQVLYWISTRSGFNASAVAAESSGTILPSSNGNDRGIGSAACSSIAACAKTGLVGDCCPTTSGSFLDCCSR